VRSTPDGTINTLAVDWERSDINRFDLCDLCYRFRVGFGVQGTSNKHSILVGVVSYRNTSSIDDLSAHS
jgi:hypothetical protein